MALRSGFPLIGEPLSLDLVNTRFERHGRPVDLLDTPDQLAAWVRAEGGRLTWSGRATDADLTAVHTLREACASLVSAKTTGAQPDRLALASINAALQASGDLRMLWPADGPRMGVARQSQRDQLMHTLAADLAGLLTGPDGGNIRTCDHPGCVLQFVARNPRRRWCSSTACGNRARVARNYARRTI
jgi:predicted RNA-binding Zn ribbon-like protein